MNYGPIYWLNKEDNIWDMSALYHSPNKAAGKKGMHEEKQYNCGWAEQHGIFGGCFGNCININTERIMKDENVAQQ